MIPLLCLALLAPSRSGLPEPCCPPLNLEVTCACGETVVIPYEPQPGDILIFRQGNPVGNVLCHLCGGVNHAALVVAQCDGTLAMMETPHFGSPVSFTDIDSEVRSRRGQAWVRRRRVPLTLQESARLTTFAYSQEGKSYDWRGLFRVSVSLPVRVFSRGCLDSSEMNPPAWFCSSLVAGACVSAGLLDRCRVWPRGCWPCDLKSDRLLDLSEGWHRPARVVFEGRK